MVKLIFRTYPCASWNYSKTRFKRTQYENYLESFKKDSTTNTNKPLSFLKWIGDDCKAFHEWLKGKNDKSEK